MRVPVRATSPGCSRDGHPVIVWALEALTPIVYVELRRIAEGYLRRERRTHTLQPTALVHEAWLRLVRQDELSFGHRKQFYGLAARVMRSILVGSNPASGTR